MVAVVVGAVVVVVGVVVEMTDAAVVCGIPAQSGGWLQTGAATPFSQNSVACGGYEVV